MIRQIIKEDIEKCIELIKASNVNENKIRYYPENHMEIINHINKRINSPKHLIFISETDDEIDGYIELLIESKERYLQILAFFSLHDFSNSFSKFYNILQDKYLGFTVDFVVNDYNTHVINFMRQNKAASDGIEIMLSINKEDYSICEYDDVMLLPKVLEPQFIEIHNHNYKNVYWQGLPIINNKDKFVIFVYLNKNKIIAYVVLSQFNRDEEEIYFVYGNDKQIRTKLIDHALSTAFRNAESVLLLLSHHEKMDLDDYLKLGFKIKEKIISYRLKI